MLAAGIFRQHVVLLNMDLSHLACVCSHLLNCCKIVWFKLKLFLIYPQSHITAHRKQTLECVGLWPFSIVSLCSMRHWGVILLACHRDMGYTAGQVACTGRFGGMHYWGETLMVQGSVFSGRGAGSNPHWGTGHWIWLLSLIGVTQNDAANRPEWAFLRKIQITSLSMVVWLMWNKRYVWQFYVMLPPCWGAGRIWLEAAQTCLLNCLQQY